MQGENEKSPNCQEGRTPENPETILIFYNSQQSILAGLFVAVTIVATSNRQEGHIYLTQRGSNI